MYLGWPQYLFHGTNMPLGSGRRVSSGCIRLYPEDIELLFELVPTGPKVRVVDQPVKLGWIDGELFIEAHPNQEQSDQLETLGRFDPILDSGVVDLVLAAAGDAAARLDWSKIRESAMERRGYPERITR
jgi:L,D-transpeptidase ErfK/SrfK